MTTPPAESVRTRVCSLLRSSTRVSSGPAGLALLDQAVVSGVNFAFTMVLARFAGPVELAVYSLGFSIVLLALAAQETLITLPYTVYAGTAPDSLALR